MHTLYLDPATERELLESAAKAIDLQLHPTFYTSCNVPALTADARWWNPLCRAEDCSHLEAALLLDVSWSEESVSVSRDWTLVTVPYAQHGGSRQIARQHAVVQVAATLGPAL